MSADHTYSGWTNWETWNTALWMGNDEYLEPESRRIVAEHFDQDDPTDLYGAGWALRDWWTTMFDPEETGGTALPGPIADAWNATLGEVNWQEIAEHLVPEADDDEPDDGLTLIAGVLYDNETGVEA